MSEGLASLREQGLAFNKTLEEHNEIIDRVTKKTDARDATIADQDKKIRRIMK